MAAELFAAPFKLSAPHPQQIQEFSLYKMKEILTGENFFADEHVLNATKLVYALESICVSLMDNDLYEKTLPLLTLMEYVASQICLYFILINE